MRPRGCARCSPPIEGGSHLTHLVRCHLTQAKLGRKQNQMTDQLGADFDRRLKAGLDRFYGPNPQPENARFSRTQAPRRPIGPIKAGVAAAGALAVLLAAASVVAGGPDPSTWTQKAVSSFEAVTHAAQSSSSPASTPSPRANSQPPARTSPAEPQRESPEPSDESHAEPSVSPTRDPGTHDSAAPSPTPSPGSDDGGERGSPSPSPSASQP